MPFDLMRAARVGMAVPLAATKRRFAELLLAEQPNPLR
jgi:hypothetical protein